MVEVVLSPGRSVVYSGRSIKITRRSVRLLEFLIAISNARDQPAHVKPKSQLPANKKNLTCVLFHPKLAFLISGSRRSEMEDTRQQIRPPKPAYHILRSQPSVDQETDNSISPDRTYRTYVHASYRCNLLRVGMPMGVCIHQPRRARISAVCRSPQAAAGDDVLSRSR